MAKRHKAGQVEIPRERHDDVSAGGMQVMPTAIGSGTDEAERQYSPWMVVTRKKLGQKGTRKGTSLEGTTRSTRNAEDMGHATMSSNGPSLGPFTGFGFLWPIRSAQEGQDKIYGSPFNPKSLSQASLRLKNKPRTSVKGIKVIARGMGISGYPTKTAAPQNQSKTFSAESPSLFNNGADNHPHGDFKFVAREKSEMGIMSREEGIRNPRNLHHGKKGGAYQRFELGHSQLEEGVDTCLDTFGSNLRADTKLTEVRIALNSSGDGDGCPRACSDSSFKKGPI